MATENDENMMIDEMVTIAKDQDHNILIDVAMEATVMVGLKSIRVNDKTYNSFKVMGVVVAGPAEDVVMDAVVVVVADVVGKQDKEGLMENPDVPNLLIGIDRIFQEDVKLKRQKP